MDEKIKLNYEFYTLSSEKQQLIFLISAPTDNVASESESSR